MKRRLKSWVETPVIILWIMSFIVLASDSESTITFIVVHLIGLGIFILLSLILYKYTDMFDKE